MDQVEVSALRSGLLGLNDGLGRRVEIVFRKVTQQRDATGFVEAQDDIEVVGDAWLAVNDRRGGAGNHIGSADLFESLDEEG